MKITKRQLRRIIKEETARLQEQRDPSPGYDYDPDSDPRQHAQARLEQEQYEEYKAWVKETGQVTPAASSVMATYFIDQGLESDHELHEFIAGGFGVDHGDVMREIEFQQKEYEAGSRPGEHKLEFGGDIGTYNYRNEGKVTSLGSMPDSWRQILGTCLGKNK